MSTVEQHEHEQHEHEQSVTAQLSTAIVRVVKEHTGRGPTKVRTIYTHDVVVTIMQDTLTRAEMTLVENGQSEMVLDLRRQLQSGMRTAAVGEVEGITGRKVVAFMSDNHIEPDMAAETFVLEPEPEEAA